MSSTVLPCSFADGLHGVEALLDGVLVGAGEGRVDQVAHVRVARVDLHLVAVLPRTTDLVDVGEVDLRVDALREQVHAQGDQVDVAGALALPEQTALDAVGAGHQRQLGRRDGRTAVVVRVDGDDDVLAAGQVAAHPLEAVRVRRRRRTLHRGGQVEDDLAARTGLVDVHHRLADLQREVQLGVGEDLRAVLVPELGLRAQQLLRVLHHQPRAVHGDLLDVVLGAAEHDPAEDGRGGVVQVHGRPLGALQRLHGPLDQVLTGLGQYGDGDVVRDGAGLFDDRPYEVEVRLAGGREADLDLLVAHLDQLVEHPALALGRHRVDQGLVAVAQVGGEPAGGDGDPVVRPRAVGDVDLLVLPVLVDRHGRGLLAVRHDAWAPRWSGKDGRRNTKAPRGGGRPRLQALAAAAKEKQPETHDAEQRSRVLLGAGGCISMRDRGEIEDKKCARPHRARETPSGVRGTAREAATNESPPSTLSNTAMTKRNPYGDISPIMVASSDTPVTECNGASHDDQRGPRARLLHRRTTPRPRQALPRRGPGARRTPRAGPWSATPSSAPTAA